MTPTKFLIDGIDRLGKSTLINNIQEQLGYHLVIHYDKPKKLRTYVEQDSSDALRYYQEQANRGMFELLKSNVPIIFDRTHLGELVYAPLYRKYSGEYVYEMEKELIGSKPYTHQDDIRLILLTSSNTEMLQDDGLSFDFTKKAEEQQLFIDAFNKSNLTNKVIVDVHNGKGGYKHYLEVLVEAMYNPSTK
jgi:nicotinamide riboside kinase